MKKALQDCVGFAHWCDTNKLRPYDAAQLIDLANRAFDARVAEANGGKDSDRKARAFEDKAKEHGFQVQWAGLWPDLMRDGVEIRLPSI